MANKDIPIEVVFKCLYRDYKKAQLEIGQEKAYSEELETYIHELEEQIKSVQDKEPSPAADDLQKQLDKEKQRSTTFLRRANDLTRLLKGANVMRDAALSKLRYYEKRYGKEV